MTEFRKCLNEWNIIVEALGQGKQTILIRKYDADLNKFLLYPTIPYMNKDDLLVDSFQDYEFAFSNLLPWSLSSTNRSYLIKYYATVEEVIEVPLHKLDAFSKFHIWTNDHIKNYYLSKRNNPYIWILRVYKLDRPRQTGRNNGIIYSTVWEPPELEGKPVLSDAKFAKLKEEILNAENEYDYKIYKQRRL